MATAVEAAGTVAETAGQKQVQAAKDAASAVAEQRGKVAELRAEYQSRWGWATCRPLPRCCSRSTRRKRGVAASAALSSKQIEANAAAIATRNKVAQAGLNLELAQEKASEATARAAGNEAAVVASKIRQKEIEIKIVQATVKAMSDEAAASIRVAEAKLKRGARSSKEGLSPELEAELRDRIELAKAKQLEAATEAGIGVAAG